ncbi:MAG: radical SAM protein [Methanogenium sp.]|nr:radical SAM protein [Methanogenium sp.]
MSGGILQEKAVDLELCSGRFEWKGTKEKTRILFCAINEPGYYSLPIRILSLLVLKNPSLSARFDPKFSEWENSANKTVLNEWIQRIVQWNPQILALSVNIWNKKAIFKLAGQVKAICSDTCIVAGGQEVTRSVVDYLNKHSELDYLIDGDGEVPIQQFLTAWNHEEQTVNNPSNISGLWHRKNGRSIFSGTAISSKNLDMIPSPILSGLVPVHEKNRLGVLLETTRGCPFRCSYCFEGSRKHLIQLESLNRLEQEIEYMVSRGATLFHILDPILCNSKIGHLQKISEIFKKIKKKYHEVSVAVEIYGEQITEQNIQYMDFCTIMDIGLQSIHPKTIKAIHRVFDMDRFKRGIKLLHTTDIFFNIYLICGLPHESLTDFFKGIRFVLKQNPPAIFINYLCLLNGTELRERAEEYGYSFKPEPPYKVTCNWWMSKQEMLFANKASNVIANKHNLSFLKYKIQRFPWVKGLKSQSRGKLTFFLEGGCSLGCSGCFRTWQLTESSFQKKLEIVLDQAFNHDVELVCGDGTDIETLCLTASKFQLAGATRISLTAPILLIEQTKDLQCFINSGIWHYTLYVNTDSQYLSSVIGHVLKKRYRLNIPVTIKPFTELVFTGFCSQTGVVEKAIDDWGNNAELLTFPDYTDVEFCIRIWKSLFFETLINYGCYVKLPENVMASVLEDMPDKESVIRHMKFFQLTEKFKNTPPCHGVVMDTTL